MISFAKEVKLAMLILFALALVILVAAVSPPTASAHEVRPAYLELREEAPDEFGVLFKTPMQGELRLALSVSLSGLSEAVSPVLSRTLDNAMGQTWRGRIAGSLAGREIRVIGL